MTIAEQLRREGEATGRVRALAEVLRKALVLEFGGASPEHEAIIANANADELERYVDRVLKVSNVNDVFEA